MLKVNYMFKSKQSSWKLFRQKILPPCVNIVNIKQLSSSGKKETKLPSFWKKKCLKGICVLIFETTSIWKSFCHKMFCPVSTLWTSKTQIQLTLSYQMIFHWKLSKTKIFIFEASWISFPCAIFCKGKCYAFTLCLYLV